MLNNNLELAEKYLDRCYKIKPDYEKLNESFILLTLFQGDNETVKYLVDKYLDKDPENSFVQDIKRYFLE